MAEEFVIIGKITSAFGVNGWVKVFSYSEPRLNILSYKTWLIKQGDEWQSVKLLNGRQQGKTIAVQLAGVTDRNAAECLSGAIVGIREEQLDRDFCCCKATRVFLASFAVSDLKLPPDRVVVGAIAAVRKCIALFLDRLFNFG